MSFDPRSLERLRELGSWSLPQALPEPERPVSPKAQQVRTKLKPKTTPRNCFAS